MSTKVLLSLSIIFAASSSAGRGPVSKRAIWSNTTSTTVDWLTISNTSVSWPTWTNYLYGPTTGPNASVVTCNAQWIEYSARSEALHSLGPTASIVASETYLDRTGACEYVTYTEGWNDVHKGPMTTLCDGYPRVLGPLETATSEWPGTGPCVTYPVTLSSTSLQYNIPEPKPNCSLTSTDCVAIWDTYRSLRSTYDSVTQSGPATTVSPLAPYSCRTPKRTTTGNPCYDCHINADTVTLFYWPITTSTSNLCSPNATASAANASYAYPTAAPTLPKTYVLGGNTFTSPSVYISFSNVNAYSNRRVGPGGPCGTTHQNTIITVDPTDVSTIRTHRNGKYPIIGTRYPINFADFNLHVIGDTNTTMSIVPYPAYRGGFQCPPYESANCTTIRDDYAPWLLLPEAVRQIDPLWTWCDLWWQLPVISAVPLGDNVVHDAVPTYVLPTQTVSASPQSPVVPPTPTPTA